MTTPASPKASTPKPGGSSLTVVTAADQTYWRCLHQLLLSAERYRLNEGYGFIAYDLGLETETRRRLQERFPWCLVARFERSKYPSHVGHDLRTFAWKPFVIRDALLKMGGLVLWLDSATLFQSALEDVVVKIAQLGVYTLRSQTAMGLRCDLDILKELLVPAQALQRPEFAAGVIGVDSRNPIARKLVETWCSYHLIEGYVRLSTPPHKSDQSLLNIVLYAMEAAGELVLSSDEIDISSRHPVRWMTSRNIVPNWLPLWLDPIARAYYAIYKTIDRADLRLKYCLQRLSGRLRGSGPEGQRQIR